MATQQQQQQQPVGDYVEQAERALKFLKESAATSDWIDTGTVEGVATSYKSYGNSSISLYRGIKLLSLEWSRITELADILWKEDNSFETLKTYDTDFLSWECLEVVVPDQTNVEYSAYAAPWPVWGRDFCTIHARRTEDGGSVYHWYVSTLHPKAPEHPETFVRGQVTIIGHIFEKEGDNKIKLTRLMHIEPQGYIPGWLIDQNAYKQVVKVINDVDSVCARLRSLK